MNLKGNAKRQNHEEQERERLVASAARAGDMISFFINGGNETKWADAESAKDAVIMTVAWLHNLMAPVAHAELVKKLGLQWGHNAAGTPILQRGTDAFPKR